MLSFRILTGKQLKLESIVGNEDPLLMLLPSPPLLDLNMVAAAASYSSYSASAAAVRSASAE
jgi:hypothetical protein